MTSLQAICAKIYLFDKQKFEPNNKKFTNVTARLYYIKFINKKQNYCLYKLGFTQRTVAARLNEFVIPDFNIEIIQICQINKPKIAYSIEQFIHKENRKYKYTGSLLLEYGNGNSEVYSRDILFLDGINNGFIGKFKV